MKLITCYFIHIPSSPILSTLSKLNRSEMDKPIKIESLDRNQDYPKSPEFEFWMVRNPSIPQPQILTADQLFSDGLLLPLHNIDHVTSPMPQHPVDDVELVASDSDGPLLISSVAAVSEPATGSRRWKDIFKKSEYSKLLNPTDQKMDLPKKRERRINSGGGGGGGGEQTTSAAVLNIISIWPFSRSRSAKTNSPRPKVTTGGRKVSSAPCSRSNSGSESKSRKFRGSPARGGGVHVGRSSPVWQARRGGTASLSRLSTVDFGGGKGTNFKGCNAASNGGDIGGGSHDGSGVVNRFNFRNLFSSSRKVY